MVSKLSILCFTIVFEMIFVATFGGAYRYSQSPAHASGSVTPLTSSVTVNPSGFSSIFMADSVTRYWNITPSIRWHIYVNPGPGKDASLCVAEWGDYVFAVGEHNITSTDTEFMVYKLLKSTGDVVEAWRLNPSTMLDILYGCVVTGNKLYVVGTQYVNSYGYVWSMLALNLMNLSDYISKQDHWYGSEWALSVTSDGNYLFIVGGADPSNMGHLAWDMQKRNLDLTLVKHVWHYYYQGSTIRGAYAADVKINPVTGNIWVLGLENDTSLASIRIYDNSLNVLKYFGLPATPVAGPIAWFYLSITFDNLGNAYIGVGNKILVYDKNGNFLKSRMVDWNVSKLLCISSYIYVFAPSKLLILDRDLQVVATIDLPGFTKGAVFDGINLYTSGYATLTKDDYSWIVYSFSPLVGRLHLALRGYDGKIYYGWDEGAGKWSDWVLMPGSTTDTPAALEYGGRLYMAVRGGDNRSIWFGYFNLSQGTFSGWQLVPGSTSSKPALAAYNGTLYLVVRGTNNMLYLKMLSIKNMYWSQWINIPGSTSDAPSIATLQGKLHVVVRGSDGRSLWHGQLDLKSMQWLGWTLISGSTPSAPSLASDMASLYLAVRGMDNKIYVRQYIGAWTAWERIPTGSTQAAPAIGSLSGILYVFVRGNDGKVYYNMKTGSGWGQWAVLNKVTPNSPAISFPPA